MSESPRKSRAHLVVALVGFLAASCRPAAALDEAGRCLDDKLRAHRMAASAHLYCERAFGADDARRATCLDRAANRLRRRLAAVEAAALAAGFHCPAGAEALGLDGALSWTTRFVHESTTTASPECLRDSTTAAQRLGSAYHRCLSGRIRGTLASEEDFTECTERARTRFDAAWQRASACVTDDAQAAGDRIVAEIDESAARLQVRCGDGHVAGFEQCDDGGTAGDDGCSADCLDETCDRVEGEVRCLACPQGSVPAADYASCVCPHGFEGTPGACTDIDECTNGEGQCGEGQACVNLQGTWACAIACTADAFHAALASCGAPSGAIAFDCTNTVIPIPAGDVTEPRDIECSNLTIDGAGRGITFQLDPLCWQTPLDDPLQCPGGIKENGTCFCPNVDSGEPFLLLRGNGNVVRDLTVRGFFEGIPVRGRGNVVEDVRFERMCDDAFGSVLGGVGNVFRRLDVRDGCDKCSENEGILADTDPDPRVPAHFHAILSDVSFTGCATPVRVAASGRLLLDHVRMTGGDAEFPCDGPRFSAAGESERVAVYMKNSLVDGCRRGVRFGTGADGILTGTRIANGGLRGLRIAGTSRVSVEGTTIEANGGGGSTENGFGGAAVTGQAALDLGGGLLEIDGRQVTSAGGNSLCFNVGPDGGDRDLDNATAAATAAGENWWCSLASPAAQILGPAGFEPFLSRAPLGYRPGP